MLLRPRARSVELTRGTFLQELDLVTRADGPDNQIDVLEFLSSLDVPMYDDYDPWGKSKAREQLFLRNTASSAPPRNFSRHYFRVPEAPVAVKKKEEKKPQDEGEGPASKKPKHKPGAGLARKYLRQIADEMDAKGVSLLDLFRKIDIDASGAIDKEEFGHACDMVGVHGLGKAQTDFMFDHVDENGNAKLDLHELQTALLDSQIDDASRSSASASGSRPSTFRPDDTQGLRQTAGSAAPWAQSKQGTRIDSIVPPDHFNLRFRRSLMPPYATSETVDLRALLRACRQCIITPVEREPFINAPSPGENFSTRTVVLKAPGPRFWPNPFTRSDMCDDWLLGGPARFLMLACLLAGMCWCRRLLIDT